MIKLELEVEEVNQILEALGDRPFKSVFQLINKIQRQAATQLSEDNPAATEINSKPNPQQS